MLVSDLVDYVRNFLLDDKVEPYLWSDDILTTLAKEAEKEACIRANLLIDSSTYSFDTEVGVDTYQLSDNIIKPIKLIVRSDAYEYELFKTNLGKPVGYSPISGLPYQYTFLDNNNIRIYPIPDDTYHIKVIASVYPSADNISFSIPERYQIALGYYVAGTALLAEDIDATDVQKSAIMLEKFAEAFGNSKDYKSIQRERFANNSEKANSNAKSFGFV
jgi:hypothetical protein